MGCGLIQLSSKPVSYYKDVIRASAYSTEMKKFRLNQFNKFLSKYNLKDKKIVEIGCGKGEYLSLMKECGADVYGIENLDSSVKACQNNSLNVTKGYIDKSDYKLTNAPYDAFFILNFLEHIPNLNEALKGIANNLKDDGIGLIEVPNFDMILKKKLFSEFIADHLYYFTQKTLRNSLEFNGFEVLECKTIWYGYIISAVVKKRNILDMSQFKNHQRKLKQEINSYIDKHSKVAIWGAGHQALAIISLADIKNKIKFVIDSAPFKQGYYTPASHLKIVSPQILSDSQIDTIIVMSASYSDEVASIIQKEYKYITNVAILRDYGLEIIR
jgi:2-polyprenyl-3-methyl-5-hydroxy-6-metoxy-1,4-benzoquinol methylase